MTFAFLPSVEETSLQMWENFMHGNFDLALRLAKNILNRAKGHCRARCIQSVVAWRNGDMNLALKLISEAIETDPRDYEALKIASRQYMEAGRYREALTYLELTHALVGSFETEMDLALSLLAMGRWTEGWAAMEARVPRELKVAKFRSEWAMWDGKPDPRVLVLPEMGFGDAIQFARYNQSLPTNAVVWTRKALGRLLATQGVEVHTLPLGSKPPAHTSWAFHMSLPHILSQPNPTGEPYLGPGIAPATVLRRAGRPAVGLVWGGSPLAPRDRLRSLPGAELEKLVTYDKVDWHILQQGPYQASIRPWSHLPHIHSYELTDFLHTAELILALDAVVTVDTSVAHLAGALGKPVYVLLSTVPDMRYPGLGITNPWYSSMSVYRQSRPGDWTSPITQVLTEMERL